MCVLPLFAILIPFLLVLAPLSVPLLPFALYYWYRERKRAGTRNAPPSPAVGVPPPDAASTAESAGPQDETL